MVNDVLKLEKLLLRLREAFRCSDDMDYEARADSFNAIHEYPEWFYVELGTQGNALDLFTNSIKHTAVVKAILPDGSGMILMTVAFDNREDAFECAKAINKILDKVYTN